MDALPPHCGGIRFGTCSRHVTPSLYRITLTPRFEKQHVIPATAPGRIFLRRPRHRAKRCVEGAVSGSCKRRKRVWIITERNVITKTGEMEVETINKDEIIRRRTK